MRGEPTAGRSSAKASRLAGIEGLRAIAAASVLVYHVFLYGAPNAQAADLGVFTKVADNLKAGVTLFFVLSGFLLYRVFVGAALRDQPMPSVRQYLRNRALRILPAYWVILVGVTLVFHHDLFTKPLEFGANFLLLQNYVPSYAIGGSQGVGIVPAWSLVIEVSFYLLVPIVGYLAIRLSASRGHPIWGAFVPVVLMTVAGIASKGIARGMGPGDVLTVWQEALPVHADWFAAGMAVAVVRVLYEDGRLRLRRAPVAAGAVAALAAAALATKLYYGGTVSLKEQQSVNAVLFAFVLAFVVMSPPHSIVIRSLSLRPLVFVGLASYSLFLVHDPLVRGFRDWGITSDGAGGFVANLALISVISLVLASASYLFVERPALARKRGWQAGDRAGLGSSAPPKASRPSHQSPAIPGVAAPAVKEL
jgi:peptidoglycan/LPS O-acetylase OafA/YrhL